MRKAPKPKALIFDTLKQAAAHYGLDPRQIKWCRESNWPGFDHGRVHANKFGPYLKERQGEIPAIEELIGNKERIEGLRARKLELEIGKLEGDFISRTELSSALAALGAEIDAVLKQKLVEEIPLNCPGMQAEELAKFCEASYSAIIEKWKAFTEKWEP
jgi:hypothetical protein